MIYVVTYLLICLTFFVVEDMFSIKKRDIKIGYLFVCIVDSMLWPIYFINFCLTNWDKDVYK